MARAVALPTGASHSASSENKAAIRSLSWLANACQAAMTSCLLS
jgi:hypothetical protein